MCLSCSRTNRDDSAFKELVNGIPQVVMVGGEKELCARMHAFIQSVTNEGQRLSFLASVGEAIKSVDVDRRQWAQRPISLRRQRELSWKISEMLCGAGAFEMGMDMLVSNVEKYSREILLCGPYAKEQDGSRPFCIDGDRGRQEDEEAARNQCIRDLEHGLGTALFAWASFWPNSSKRIPLDRARGLERRVEAATGQQIRTVGELTEWRSRRDFK